MWVPAPVVQRIQREKKVQVLSGIWIKLMTVLLGLCADYLLAHATLTTAAETSVITACFGLVNKDLEEELKAPRRHQTCCKRPRVLIWRGIRSLSFFIVSSENVKHGRDSGRNVDHKLFKICEEDIIDGGCHEQPEKQSMCSSNYSTWYMNIAILSRAMKPSLHIQPKWQA